MKSVVLFLLIINIYTVLTANKKLIRTSIKSLKCDSNSKFVQNYTCRLRPTRDGHGLTTIAATVVGELNEIWIQNQMFYKYTTQFRPWLVNVDYDFCCVMSQKCDLAGLPKLGLHAQGVLTPVLVHECPYSGTVGVFDMDFDRLFDLTLPQIIPSGEYKMVVRFHSKQNETFFNIVYTITISAMDAMQTQSIDTMKTEADLDFNEAVAALKVTTTTAKTIDNSAGF